MSDEIKIRVGVQNNVKAGMDGVVKDVRGGIDRSMRGKGFMEAFTKAIRGDISGAMEDLSERMGAGMNGIMGKAVIWGGGIATALFSGFKAGQQLDKIFGLSDKIGGALANRFGVQEDHGLKAQVEQLKAARKEREAAANEEIENQRRMAKAAISGIEAQNKAISEKEIIQQEVAIQDKLEERNWRNRAEASGKQQGLFGRLMGRGNRDFGAEADYTSKMALDDGFRREEQNADRQEKRAASRAERLLNRASDPDQRRYSPQLRRIFEADQKQQAAEQLRQQAKKREDDAWQAAIDSAIDARETAKNTREIRKLQEQLLRMK
jgi:hypothetical protein